MDGTWQIEIIIKMGGKTFIDSGGAGNITSTGVFAAGPSAYQRASDYIFGQMSIAARQALYDLSTDDRSPEWVAFKSNLVQS